MSETKLANQLNNKPDNDFVEYEHYFPSNEPAAFFVVAVKHDNELLGWFILQCAINKINTFLTDYKNLGRTGEVYLINKENLMLSESRFIEDTTVLRLKIDTIAVKEALSTGSGNRIIKDYRGVTVYSSFEQFKVFNRTWIIIAEMDENEVITGHYTKYKNYYLKRIYRYLSDNHREEKGTSARSVKLTRKVDMNEFDKAVAGEVLVTKGVGPCTAVVISYSGKFAYLAHISPLDNIYINNPLSRIILKDKSTDFLYDLLKRIKHYDIYPYELRNLSFYIIAAHNKSLRSIIEQLLSHDVDIAQIKFIFNPQVDSVNVMFDLNDNVPVVEWLTGGRGGAESFSEETSGVDDLGSIVKKIIRYDDEII